MDLIKNHSGKKESDKPMITPKNLLDMGFKGEIIGNIIKESKKWSDDEIQHFLLTKEKPVKIHETLAIKEDSVLHWLINNPCVNNLLQSSNSQKRRWLSEGAVVINGKAAKSEDVFPTGNLQSLVFFPKSQLKITMM